MILWSLGYWSDLCVWLDQICLPHTWTSCFLLLERNNLTLTVANAKKQNTVSVQQMILPFSLQKKTKVFWLNLPRRLWWRSGAKEQQEHELEKDRPYFSHKPEKNCPGAEVSGVYRYQVTHSLTCSSGAVTENFDVLGGSCETSSPSGTGLRSSAGDSSRDKAISQQVWSLESLKFKWAWVEPCLFLRKSRRKNILDRLGQRQLGLRKGG